MINIKTVIEIDLYNKQDFYDKYNHKIISQELINYIKNQASHANTKKLEILINRHCRMDDDYLDLLKNTLKNDYLLYRRKLHLNNITQVLFLICGFILLILSHGIKKYAVLEEILLICGWVFIWEMIELQLFTDSKNIYNCKILKKLSNTNIQDKYCKDDFIL